MIVLIFFEKFEWAKMKQTHFRFTFKLQKRLHLEIRKEFCHKILYTVDISLVRWFLDIDATYRGELVFQQSRRVKSLTISQSESCSRQFILSLEKLSYSSALLFQHSCLTSFFRPKKHNSLNTFNITVISDFENGKKLKNQIFKINLVLLFEVCLSLNENI